MSKKFFLTPLRLLGWSIRGTTGGAALALLAAPLCLSAQEAATPTPPSAERSFTIQVTQRDRPVERLSTSDLQVEVDGQSMAIKRLQPLTARGEFARIVLYFELPLSRPRTISWWADALAQKAATLVRAGSVEVVIADPTARQILPPTQDPEAVRNALARLSLQLQGEDALRQRRTALREATVNLPDGTARAEQALSAFGDEVAMLRVQQDELLAWLGDQPAGTLQHGSPSFLFLAHDALGFDPSPFYVPKLRDLSQAADFISRIAPADDVARAATALGWSVFLLSTPEDETSRFDYAPDEQRPVGFRLRLGKTDAAASDTSDQGAEDLEWKADDAARAELAAMTGGEIVANDARLEEVAESLIHRFFLTVDVAPEKFPLDARRLPSLSVTSKTSRSKVTAPRSLPTGSATELDEVRLRRLLNDGTDPVGAELEAAASLNFNPTSPGATAATLKALAQWIDPDRAELLDDEPWSGLAGPWRLSIGIHQANGDWAVRSERFEQTAQADAKQASDDPLAFDAIDEGVVSYSTSLVLPRETDGGAVVMTHLPSGAWGFATIDFDTRDLEPPPVAVPTAVTLLPLVPQEQPGKVLIRTETAPEVTRVEFLLNGKRIARRSRRPFEVRVDLGQTGRTLQLVAVALDREGNELGRDRQLLNEPADTFWVRIVEPEPGSGRGGDVTVVAEIKAPSGSEIAALDLYWKDRRLAHLTAPPWRAEVRVPVNDRDGFFRAEASLVDGRSTEDVLVTGRTAFGEQIGVELVELFLVATDNEGRPVRDLQAADFRVIEDGKPQGIDNFQVAGDLPITVGLAIDSSSSLFVKMPEVKAAAKAFVSSLETNRDRAMLVGFGSAAHVLQEPTLRLERISEEISRLVPYGATAVWGAINLSLQRLDGIDGRRALVVFYDGDDEDSEQEFRRSLRLARRARLPIYLILLNNEAARTAGRSLSSRSFVSRLEAISRSGGGRVYYVDSRSDLQPIFLSIAEELRSHYLLTYYPTQEPGGPLWRPVEVVVNRRGVTARTIEGREVIEP